MERYLELIRPVFGADLKYDTASEGQAAAFYMCEPFDDVTGLSRIRLRTSELFGDVRSTCKNLTFVDVGSSTLVCSFFPFPALFRYRKLKNR